MTDEQGLDGIEYVLNCIIQDYDVSQVQWQWLLGRFYILDNLLEEYPREFMVNKDKLVDNNCDPPVNFTRIMDLLKFCAPVLSFPHSKVEKLARRIFYLTARLQIHNYSVLKEILQLLEDTDTTIRNSMKRRLLKLQEQYHFSNHSQDKEGGHVFTTEICEEVDPIFTTPVLSGTSTPCSLSPVPSDSTGSDIVVTLSQSHPQMLPIAPPNSPRKPPERRSKSMSVLPEVQAELHQMEDCTDGFSSPVNTTAQTSTQPRSIGTEAGDAPSPAATAMHNTEHPILEHQDSGLQATLDIFPVQFTDAPARAVPKIQVPGITSLISGLDPESPQIVSPFVDQEEEEFHNMDMYRKYAEGEHEDLISFSPEPAYDDNDSELDNTVSTAPSVSPESPFSASYRRADTLLIREFPGDPSPLNKCSLAVEEALSDGDPGEPTESGEGLLSLDSKESPGRSVLSLVVQDEEFSETEAKVKDEEPVHTSSEDIRELVSRDVDGEKKSVQQTDSMNTVAKVEVVRRKEVTEGESEEPTLPSQER